MSSAGSVTQWIDTLRQGDSESARRLWERYFGRLTTLAARKLQGNPRRAADEEDVALSALASLCRGLERGQFERLRDRNDLWQLLASITVHKALDRVKSERRVKRGRGVVLDEAALAAERGGSSPLEELLDRAMAPEAALAAAEECQRLLRLLDDAELQQVAVLRVEGYSNADIAQRFGCSRRRIERKVRLIRCLWEEETRA